MSKSFELSPLFFIRSEGRKAKGDNRLPKWKKDETEYVLSLVWDGQQYNLTVPKQIGDAQKEKGQILISSVLLTNGVALLRCWQAGPDRLVTVREWANDMFPDSWPINKIQERPSGPYWFVCHYFDEENGRDLRLWLHESKNELYVSVGAAITAQVTEEYEISELAELAKRIHERLPEPSEEKDNE